MKYSILASLCFACTLTLFAQAPTASINTFDQALGLHTGMLQYKDYTSGELVDLELVGVASVDKDELVLEHAIYEHGDVFRQKYAYKFKNGKVYYEGAWDVVEQEKSADGKLAKLVITKAGKDGNDRKPCTFRLTFSYENQTLSITKDVKFDDEKEYFMRNRYVLNHYPHS